PERRVAYDGPAQEQAQAEEKGEEVDGSTHETDAGRLEEEPDLPRRGGRLALAARRPVHRDRRALQPADAAVDDRARRGQGQGLARQGSAAVGVGFAAPEGEGDRQRLSSSSTSRGGWWT